MASPALADSLWDTAEVAQAYLWDLPHWDTTQMLWGLGPCLGCHSFRVLSLREKVGIGERERGKKKLLLKF